MEAWGSIAVLVRLIIGTFVVRESITLFIAGFVVAILLQGLLLIVFVRLIVGLVLLVLNFQGQRPVEGVPEGFKRGYLPCKWGVDVV